MVELEIKLLELMRCYMQQWICQVCGYIYVPEENDNVNFVDLPEDWLCPVCGADKSNFEEA